MSRSISTTAEFGTIAFRSALTGDLSTILQP